MALGEFGRNSALKVKREIKNKLINQGYKIPSHVIPMKEVVDYLNININYLESRVQTRRWKMKALEEIDINIKKDNIIDNIMKSKGLYCLVSNAKVGKSMLALQLSNSLTCGKQFLGHDIMPSPVLYISTESDSGQIMERIR